MPFDARDGLLGLCVGDALGVPVEFRPRETLEREPVTGMRGHGTHNQPPGTWSDDASLTFCLAESLCDGYDLKHIGQTFENWLFKGHWTPHGKVFDVGGTTREAIFSLASGCDPILSGAAGEISNGNGSLMRILPMAYFLAGESIVFDRVHDVSCLTHAHPRSQIACGIYVQLAILLMSRLERVEAYHRMIEIVRGQYVGEPYASELGRYSRILDGEIWKLSPREIISRGYVVSTLEAALWCLYRSGSFSEAVLAAVNLGGDTDTAGAVTGGLAGIVYGWRSIPGEWIEALARKDDIFALADRFQGAMERQAATCRMARDGR